MKHANKFEACYICNILFSFSFCFPCLIYMCFGIFICFCHSVLVVCCILYLYCLCSPYIGGNKSIYLSIYAKDFGRITINLLLNLQLLTQSHAIQARWKMRSTFGLRPRHIKQTPQGRIKDLSHVSYPLFTHFCSKRSASAQTNGMPMLRTLTCLRSVHR